MSFHMQCTTPTWLWKSERFSVQYPAKKCTASSMKQLSRKQLMPELISDYGDCILQVDGTPTVPYKNVQELPYNRVLPQRCTGPNLVPTEIKTFSRSPDISTCDFCLQGIVKAVVYEPPIRTSIQATTVDTVHNVWNEFDYRVTKEHTLKDCRFVSHTEETWTVVAIADPQLSKPRNSFVNALFFIQFFI